MKIVASLTWVALAFSAVPLSAQISTTNDRMRTRIPGIPNPADGRVSTRTGDARVERGSRGSSRVPPGHLPPRGMCRVWIDGVPAGHQPAVTDCATAQRQRLQHANARVIYGDEESFRGRANGRFDGRRDERRGREREGCSTRDAVVIGGRVIDVCGDEQARRGRDRDDDDDDEFDDDDDDDDRRERASKSERKRQQEIEKARKRSGRGKGRG